MRDAHHTMTAVQRHYARHMASDGTLAAEVAQRLDALPPEADMGWLSNLDQFHVGGLSATMALADLADVRPGLVVLDAGAGLGGPSRYLADIRGCRVVGVDLTPSYVAIAQLLAERTGVADRVRYEVGDLTRLPFADAMFDLVWTQHVVMNVPDREAVYREFRRVLRPGGELVFYDVLAADGHPAPDFPVPWAEGPETSFLLTESETRAVLRRTGFTPRVWRDVTADAVAAFSQSPTPSSAGVLPGSPGLSLATVMGPRFASMAANLARTLRDGRARLVMARWAVLAVPRSDALLGSAVVERPAG